MASPPRLEGARSPLRDGWGQPPAVCQQRQGDYSKHLSKFQHPLPMPLLFDFKIGSFYHGNLCARITPILLPCLAIQYHPQIRRRLRIWPCPSRTLAEGRHRVTLCKLLLTTSSFAVIINIERGAAGRRLAPKV